MKAKTVTYERLKNIGNFQHEKVGIVLELTDGERADDALREAKKFVDKQLSLFPEDDQERDIRVAREVLANRENEIVRRVEWAESVLAQADRTIREELPF